MRYIDISKIQNIIKRIPYDYLKVHLGNRHDDIVKKENDKEYIDWNDIAKKHFEIITTLDIRKRKKYINDNPDWNILQFIFMKEFGLKCWYSEAPIGDGDFEIDHYRPKNRAKQSEMSKDYNLENGYWWLAYDWTNYRLSGTIANKRRRDRFSINDLVKGKGDIFPLFDRTKIAKEKSSFLAENPILLDPLKSCDPGLLSFDEDGKIFASSIIKEEKDRAEVSIKFYALDIGQLDMQRQEVWNDCKNTIEIANMYWHDDTVDYQVKQAYKNTCFDTLRKKTDLKEPFSAVAIACIKVYSTLTEYNEFMKTFNF